jgi:hypothetical protein
MSMISRRSVLDRMAVPARWLPSLESLPLAVQLDGAVKSPYGYSWSLYEADAPLCLLREVALNRGIFGELAEPIAEEELRTRQLLIVRDLRLPSSTFAPLLDELRRMVVPKLARKQNSVDGREFRLSAPIAGISDSLTWISEGPPEWRALAQWAFRMRSLCWRTVHSGEPPIEVSYFPPETGQ